jgi:hypothetical protein
MDLIGSRTPKFEGLQTRLLKPIELKEKKLIGNQKAIVWKSVVLMKKCAVLKMKRMLRLEKLGVLKKTQQF